MRSNLKDLLFKRTLATPLQTDLQTSIQLYMSLESPMNFHLERDRFTLRTILPMNSKQPSAMTPVPSIPATYALRNI
ncbi:hypothetical protein B0H11DRAFT_2229313 [Mycena galericulata]|nr:hypothetical protein B0H11DRAFT_2229313 [Mycena galericulata]